MPRPWNRGIARQWPRGLFIGVVMLVLWTVLGTVGFVVIEGWSVTDALYMTVTTISTVGFGEIHPLSPQGRLFASFLIVGGLGTAVYTLTRLGQVVLEGELLGGMGRRRMLKALGSLDNHYVLCGFGKFAKPVAEGLAHKSLPFCVIESNPGAEAHLQDLGYLYLIDDATSDEALEDAGVKNAQGVMALLPSDADNLYVTVTAKALNPQVRVIARATDERGEKKLRRGGASDVVTPYNLTGNRIIQAATSPTVLQFMDHVADRHYLEMNLGEAAVSDGSPLVGRSLGDARLRADHGVVVVALKRQGAMKFNPGPEEDIRPGDILVLMGHEDALRRTVSLLGKPA
jgi:voltage-gated potassium channel